MLRAFKKNLPSRNTCIFLGTISAFAGIKQYDNYVSHKRLEEIKLKLKPLADRPMAVTELPDKYIVFLHSPEDSYEASYKATEYFIKYVKPVWDAAAIDYEVVTEKDGGEIQKYAFKELKKLRSDPQPTKTDSTSLLPELESPVLGWVALGHEAYGKLLMGIQDGASVANLSFEPTIEEKPDYIAARHFGSLIPEEQRLGGLQVPTTTPSIGYIQFHHYYGYRYIPLRFYKWLTSRNFVEKVGTDAMELLLLEPQPLKLPSDFINKALLDFRITDLDTFALRLLSASLSDKLKLLGKKE
ncbi:mitochondrial import inner membrane translocase subunit tim54 [Entomophthora muscae]|uniref:Mitochondrial import inner membrane translocase subunit tim54 n=1 Tax=Entomophthora muscae TaxID=34485 RepID=A0ACC2RN15_9FUNG|nr:mitochondrial import inner membrane translocase subunit tim54 [Entomophthora muscae]